MQSTSDDRVALSAEIVLPQHRCARRENRGAGHPRHHLHGRLDVNQYRLCLCEPFQGDPVSRAGRHPSSEEPDPALPLWIGDLVVELRPLHALFLEVRLLQPTAKYLLCQRILLELIECLEQCPWEDVDPALRELVL